MSGLVYKDLINLKQQWKSYLLILVFWGGLSVMQKNPYFFGGMFAVYLSIVLLTACGYDEQSGWDKYALTMPVSRGRIVLSKYMLGLLLDVLGFATTAIFFVAARTPFQEMITGQCIFQTISLCMLAILLPLTFRFGVEKARTSIAVAMLTPVLIGYLVVQSGVWHPEFDPEQLVHAAYLGPAVGLCLLAVSAALSVRIYKGKEF